MEKSPFVVLTKTEQPSRLLSPPIAYYLRRMWTGIPPKILPILRIQIAPLKMPRPATSSLERGSLFLYLWKKGAPILQFRITLIITVSIHAPLKGATGDATFVAATKGVSIHAPLKGATRAPSNPPYDGCVSIHAPLKGATAIIQ